MIRTHATRMTVLPLHSIIVRPALRQQADILVLKKEEAPAPQQRRSFSATLANIKHAILPLKKKETPAKQLPVVNLKDFKSNDPARRKAFVQSMGDSLAKYGFVAIAGHSVPSKTISDYYEVLKSAFALPMDEKKKYVREDLGRNRGYFELGIEKKAAYEGGPKIHPDKKENWHSGPESTLNLFPEEVGPEFKKRNLALFKEMEKTSLTLSEAVGEYMDSIGLADKGYLKSTMEENGKPIGNHLMRAIHYPPVAKEEQGNLKAGESVIRAGQHCDMNLFTLLPESTEAGLEILPRKEGKETDEWLPIHSQEGNLIMNAGDMLSLISGGKTNEQANIIEQGALPAIRHRVVGDAKTLDKPRYSIPFFATPHYDKPLKNLKTGEELSTGEFVFRRLQRLGSLNGNGFAAFRKNVDPLIVKREKDEAKKASDSDEVD